MPQAIEWSFATPKISAFLPSSRPIRVLPRRGSGSAPSLPSGPCPKPLRPTSAPRSPASVRSSSTPTASSCSGARPIAGSPEALVELRRRGMPYRVVTNFSSAHRSSASRRRSARRPGSTVDGAEIITAASAAAAHTAPRAPGQADPRARRARRAAGMGRPGAPLPGRGGRARRAGRGRRDRRRGGRPVVREPRHRVPPAPCRRGVRGDASQPVVDDAEGLHARRRRRRRRARVRPRPEGASSAASRRRSCSARPSRSFARSWRQVHDTTGVAAPAPPCREVVMVGDDPARGHRRGATRRPARRSRPDRQDDGRRGRCRRACARRRSLPASRRSSRHSPTAARRQPRP